MELTADQNLAVTLNGDGLDEFVGFDLVGGVQRVIRLVACHALVAGLAFDGIEQASHEQPVAGVLDHDHGLEVGATALGKGVRHPGHGVRQAHGASQQRGRQCLQNKA